MHLCFFGGSNFLIFVEFSFFNDFTWYFFWNICTIYWSFIDLVVFLVLGAFWYLFSIEREMSCWHIACAKHIGCNPSSFKCQHSLRNHTFLNDYCPVEPPNTTLFDFVLCHPKIFLESLHTVSGGAWEIWGLHILHNSFFQYLSTINMSCYWKFKHSLSRRVSIHN